MDDSTYIGEADAGPFKFICAVQPLENAEEFAEVLHIESYSIISDKHGDFPGTLFLKSDGDLGDGPRAGELERIRNQIHKYLSEHSGIARYFRQCVNCPGYFPSLQVKT